MRWTPGTEMYLSHTWFYGFYSIRFFFLFRAMLHLLQNTVPVLPTTNVSDADGVLHVSLITRTCISTACKNTTIAVLVLYNLVPGRREQPPGKSTTNSDSHPSTMVTLLYLNTVIVTAEPLNRNESGRFGALISDSTHHFFRNACTK